MPIPNVISDIEFQLQKNKPLDSIRGTLYNKKNQPFLYVNQIMGDILLKVIEYNREDVMEDICNTERFQDTVNYTINTNLFKRNFIELEQNETSKILLNFAKHKNMRTLQ